MNIKKFIAATSREAYRLVRDALGADAVILSNRSVGGKVEILALPGEEAATIAEPVTERPAKPAEEAKHRIQPQVQHPAWPSFQWHSPATAGNESLDLAQDFGPGEEPLPGLASTLKAAAPRPRERAQETLRMVEVVKEIRSMRGMLESQLAELSWHGQQEREPVRKDVLRELLAAGFSAGLSRYLVEKMPAGFRYQEAMAWVKGVLARNLATAGNENDILEDGGVFALVGPTGVGKTTTTAKLAARIIRRHGPGKLALITTDGYRIGGFEQLRIYGKILGVMVHSVKDDADLRIAIEELRHKHTVLIDTVGVSQRDNMVAEQIAMLAGAGAPVRRLLCMPATSNGETLNEVVHAYQGEGLAGCIITKLDEATTIGGALDVIVRQKLPLYYVANGQRVPEDLHLANRDYMADRPFRFRRAATTFALQDNELPLIMGNAVRAKHGRRLNEVALG